MNAADEWRSVCLKCTGHACGNHRVKRHHNRLLEREAFCHNPVHGGTPPPPPPPNKDVSNTIADERVEFLCDLGNVLCWISGDEFGDRRLDVKEMLIVFTTTMPSDMFCLLPNQMHWHLPEIPNECFQIALHADVLGMAWCRCSTVYCCRGYIYSAAGWWYENVCLSCSCSLVIL